MTSPITKLDRLDAAKQRFAQSVDDLRAQRWPRGHCARCGMLPDALVHNATANGHPWSSSLPPRTTA